MKTANRIAESPTQRLERVASYALPYVREVSKRNYLIGIALGIMIGVMLLVAWLGGGSAAELTRGYAEWIGKMASPSWR